jgi:hypothetical protein
MLNKRQQQMLRNTMMDLECRISELADTIDADRRDPNEKSKYNLGQHDAYLICKDILNRLFSDLVES